MQFTCPFQTVKRRVLVKHVWVVSILDEKTSCILVHNEVLGEGVRKKTLEILLVYTQMTHKLLGRSITVHFMTGSQNTVCHWEHSNTLGKQ